MVYDNKKQFKRNILMVIGAIVVVIILVYAYLVIASEEPAGQHLLKIKKELQVNMPVTGWSRNIE